MLVASPFFREPVKTFEEQKKRAAARKGRLKALAEEKQVSSSSSEEDSSSDSDDSLSSSEGLTQPTLLTSADSQSYEWVTDSDSRSYTLVTATETADAKSARTFDRSLEHESGSIGSLTLESYNDTLEDFEKKGALGPLPEGEVVQILVVQSNWTVDWTIKLDHLPKHRRTYENNNEYKVGKIGP
eukprot:CAMPEP_0194699346 /NCGR_PEP_ID=MMETSP0295-20121207/24758_1 /TAXON_ID=39354 /ORGANISM="Heterosigma akashiwo, Strain CCMP2393" /LENGTH=184 /DNA_ID=CAMNT_0039592773 /DNA_START=197 /DNA_END=751 /DNA_ORIENTATION=-